MVRRKRFYLRSYPETTSLTASSCLEGRRLRWINPGTEQALTQRAAMPQLLIEVNQAGTGRVNLGETVVEGRFLAAVFEPTRAEVGDLSTVTITQASGDANPSLARFPLNSFAPDRGGQRIATVVPTFANE
jgi:hypothetical protein